MLIAAGALGCFYYGTLLLLAGSPLSALLLEAIEAHPSLTLVTDPMQSVLLVVNILTFIALIGVIGILNECLYHYSGGDSIGALGICVDILPILAATSFCMLMLGIRMHYRANNAIKND